MGLVIEERFLNRAIESYGNEAAAVSEAVANGISALDDSRGIAEAADAFEFPHVESANISKLGGLSSEGAIPSPSEFFQPLPPDGVSKALNDPAFNATQELPAFVKNVFGKNGVSS